MARDKAGNTIRTANQDAFSSLKPKAITVGDSIGGSDSSDYFRTRLRSRTSVELSLTNLTADANLQLLNKNGSLVRQSKESGRSDEAINLTLNAGVYYLHVVGTSKETSYSLRATGNRDKAGNTFANATPVTIDGKAVFRDYVGPSDKRDFYKFTTADDLPQQLRLVLTGLQSNANLALLDSNGKVLASNAQPGDAKEIIRRSLNPDTTYGLRVSIVGKTTPGTPFKLISTLGEVPDRVANTRDDAAKLLTLPAVSDTFSVLDTELLNVNDVDVYRIVGPNDPTAVDLTMSGLSADADLYLYEEGKPIPVAVSDQTGTGDETIVDVALKPGVNYYVEVNAFDGSDFTFFDLSARTKSGINDLAGNTPAEARNIDSDPAWNAGSTGVVQGPLDPAEYTDAVGAFDTDDYYVFTLNDPSFLSLKTDLSRGSATLQLLGSNGETALESVVGTAAANPKIEGVFAAGTYYIRVATGGTEADGFYQLNLEAESVELQPAFVKDIRFGPQSSSVPGNMVEIGGILYFAANDGSGVQLWRTDGTAVDGTATNTTGDGTEKLTDESFLSISNLTVATIGGTDVLFFTGETGETGAELWRWDAINGASLVKDIAPGEISSGIGATTGIVTVGNRIYFSAIAQGNDGTSTNIELWYSNGTAEGTNVLEIVPGVEQGSIPNNLINIGGKAYFVATNADFEDKLFTIDTSGGNVTAVEVGGQSGLGNFANLTNVKGTLYFSATGSAEGGANRGTELWRLSNTGTPEAVTDIVASSGGATGISGLTVLGNSLFFAANGNNTAGLELWEMTINPTTGVTSVAMAANINTTANNVGSAPQQLTVVNNKLYFIANDGVNGQGLWQYDPAAAVGQRASLVQYTENGVAKDVAATSGGVSLDPSPGSLIAVGNFLYFKANRTTSGSELWRVSPLLNGQAEELDLLLGTTGSSPSDFTEVNGRLFFRATDGDADEAAGRELWVVGLPENL